MQIQQNVTSILDMCVVDMTGWAWKDIAKLMYRYLVRPGHPTQTISTGVRTFCDPIKLGTTNSTCQMAAAQERPGHNSFMAG